MNCLSKKLKENDIAVDSTITRLGGNEQLYLSICKKFLKDQNFLLLQQALIIEDYSSAHNHIHTLKGVTANLGFTRLELLCKVFLEDLNNRNSDQLNQDFKSLSQEYNLVISLLTEE